MESQAQFESLETKRPAQDRRRWMSQLRHRGISPVLYLFVLLKAFTWLLVPIHIGKRDLSSRPDLNVTAFQGHPHRLTQSYCFSTHSRTLETY